MDLLRRQSRGFTLVEVMIALVILAIGLLGLAGLQIVSTRSNSFSNQMSVATTITQDKLEELRNLPYTHGDLAPTGGTPRQDPANPLKAPGDMGFFFKRSWEVTEDVTNNIKTIRVTVEWPDPDNSHMVRFTTVKSQ